MNVTVKVKTVRRYGGHIGVCRFEARDECGRVVAAGEFDTPICATQERARHLADVEADAFLASIVRLEEVPAVSHG